MTSLLRILFALRVTRPIVWLAPFVLGPSLAACSTTNGSRDCESDVHCQDVECGPGERPVCLFESSLLTECGCVPENGTGGSGGSAGADPSAQDIVEGILGVPVDDFFQFIESAPTDVETGNSNGLVPSRIPVDFIDAETTGALAAALGPEQLQRLEDLFIDGSVFSVVGNRAVEKGLTVEAEMPTALQEGPYLFVWQTMQAAIPLDDPVQLFQYAFVADHDRQVLNNYRGEAPFEDDYFDNTDLWFELEYNPEDGWNLQITDALDGTLMPLQSAARGILSGPVQMFVIPTSEFKGSSTIAARWTAFAHEGDFGQEGGPWSGDTTPVVGAALEQISLTPE